MKRNSALRSRLAPVDQSLKTWIVSERLPNRVYSQTLHSDVAWPIQQPAQNFNRLIIIAKDGVDFSHTFCYVRPVKGVLAFGLQFTRTLRLSQGGLLSAKLCERFRQLHM